MQQPADDALLQIEVVYALPANQLLKKLTVPAGTTAMQAVMLSDIRHDFPEISFPPNRLGIFSKPVQPETLLRNHDRVEIYRPLLADPKERRRKQAAKQIRKT